MSPPPVLFACICTVFSAEFFETVHYCDAGKIHISQSVIVLTFRGVYYVYTIYVCSDLLCFEGYLGNFSCFI